MIYLLLINCSQFNFWPHILMLNQWKCHRTPNLQTCCWVEIWWLWRSNSWNHSGSPRVLYGSVWTSLHSFTHMFPLICYHLYLFLIVCLSCNCAVLTSYAIVLRGSAGHSVGDEGRHFHSVAVTGRTAKHLHHRQPPPAAQPGNLLQTRGTVLETI